MAKLVFLALACALQRAACSAAITVMSAADDRVTWVGRRLASPSGDVTIDWEGVEARLVVTGATYVTAQISDSATGGARFAVYYNSTGGSGAGAPNLRIGTLVTHATVRDYVLAGGEWLAAAPSLLTLRLLTEPQFVRDGPTLASNLSIISFTTDGTFGAAPEPSTMRRRLIFLGDSLTAGYGSGFDAPPSAPTSCGGGVAQNDVANSYGAVLCDKYFGASCSWIARSGVGLIYPGGTTLPQLWPTTLGSFVGKFPWNGASVRLACVPHT